MDSIHQHLSKRVAELQQLTISPKKARQEAIEVYNQAMLNGFTDIAHVALRYIISSFITYRVVSKRSKKWINIAKKLLNTIAAPLSAYFHILLMNYYAILDNKELAEQYYQQALEIFETAGGVPPYIYINGARLYWEFGQLEKGWELLCKSEKMLLQITKQPLPAPEKQQQVYLLIHTYSYTSVFFGYVGDIRLAEIYLLAGLKLAQETSIAQETMTLKAQLLSQLCNILLETARIDECWKINDEVFHIFHHTKVALVGVDAEMGKALLFVQEQRYKEALHHINRACKLAKSSKEYLLRIRPNIVKAEILFALHEVEQARRIIDEIEEFSKTTTKHIPKRFFLIGAQVYEHIGDSAKEMHYRKLFIDEVINSSQLQLRHKFHIIREREFGTFGHDELIAKHNSQTQEHTPEPQHKEFPPSAPSAFRQFDVLTSNEYLNAIRSTLVDLLHNADTLNHKTIKAKIKSVQQLIETNYNEQDMLFAVEREIQHVHKDFIEKLSFKYPSLSHTEIRVCLLLRLNLNTHQIAAMMNISPITVFTHRKNIRKKMGITRADSLSILLMQLSGLRVEE